MKNRKLLKIIIFTLACVLMLSVLAVSALAATLDVESQDGNTDLGKIDGGDIKMSERIEYALQGTATGLLMVFAVLALLCIVVSLSKVIFYDIPRKARESAEAEAKAEAQREAEAIAPSDVFAAAPAELDTIPIAESEPDGGELIAVITAAVAAVLESGEYKNEFASGFRVVSFKRANANTWNKR